MKKIRVSHVMLITLGTLTLFLCVGLVCYSIVSPLLKLKKGFKNTIYSEAFGCTLRINGTEYSGIISTAHGSLTVFTELSDHEIAVRAANGELEFAYHIKLLDMWVNAELPEKYAKLNEIITSSDINSVLLKLVIKLFLDIDVNALPKIDYKGALESRIRSFSFLRGTLGMDSNRKDGSNIISMDINLERLLLELISERKDEFKSEEEYESAKADCTAAVKASGNSSLKVVVTINDNDEMTGLELYASDTDKAINLSFNEIGTAQIPNAFD